MSSQKYREKKVKYEEDRDNKITEQEEKSCILKENVSRLEEILELLREVVQPRETSMKPDDVDVKGDDLDLNGFELNLPVDLICAGEGSEIGLLSTSSNNCIENIISTDFNESGEFVINSAAEKSGISFENTFVFDSYEQFSWENNANRNYDISLEYDNQIWPMETFFPLEQANNCFDELFLQ